MKAGRLLKKLDDRMATADRPRQVAMPDERRGAMRLHVSHAHWNWPVNSVPPSAGIPQGQPRFS